MRKWDMFDLQSNASKWRRYRRDRKCFVVFFEGLGSCIVQRNESIADAADDSFIMGG